MRSGDPQMDTVGLSWGPWWVLKVRSGDPQRDTVGLSRGPWSVLKVRVFEK